MHTKIINPSTDGHQVYHNLGAVDRLIAYLLHESREKGEEEEIFFNRDSDHIDPGLVRHALNHNVKGLRKKEEKFFTIVVSPSERELRHIGNSDEKLKLFVRQIMEDYARHFHLKDGRKLDGEDLLWFAVIHADRKVKNLDLRKEEDYLSKKEIQRMQDLRAKGDAPSLKILERMERNARRRHAEKLDGELFQAGDPKPGLNKHVHIVVSRKERSMMYSLNPRGWKARFDLRSWQERNGRRFQELFGYSQETMHEAFYFPRQEGAFFDEKIRKTIHQINEQYLKEEKLDPEQFRRIGAKYNYSRAFFINLSKLKSRYQRGDYFVDPYHFVARGRDIRPEEYGAFYKREGKGDKRQQGGRSFSGGPFHIRELLAAFRQYRSSYVRDPMLLEGELRKRKPRKEEGKGEEPEH